MRNIMGLGLSMGLLLAGAPMAAASDDWDLASEDDNTLGSDNELGHGSQQVHDLEANAGPVADQDWYRVICYPRSSYEVVIDSMSGDVDMFSPPENFQRLAFDGTTVLQTSEEANLGSSAGGFNRALRWETGASTTNQFLRVQSALCGTDCGSEDRYRITFYETTVAVPRFNNTGGQTTVLIIQNVTGGWDRPVNGTAYFWTVNGTLTGLHQFSLFPSKSALVLNTATVAPGASGTITIAHDGGYGNLAVKSVALEPATGFSFDSPGLSKPQ